MDTINVSLGTVAAWFGKNAAEIDKALFVTNDKGEKTPLGQDKIDEFLDALYSERVKDVETTARNQGHKRGLKETAEKVESKLKGLGFEEFSSWEDGIEKAVKSEKVQVKEISVDDVRQHQEYIALKQELSKEREAHKATMDGFERKETEKGVRSFFTNFLSNSNYDLPTGETEEEKARRQSWEETFINNVMTSAKGWKLSEDGKPIPLGENGEPLEQNYKPITASSLAESHASRLFKKIDGQRRGGDTQLGTKTVEIDGGRKINIPTPKNDEEFMTTLDSLRNNPDVPIEVTETFVKEYEASQNAE